jgi:large subunit ribosomal protein L32e
MVINKDLLQLRKKISDQRPEFKRQESWRYDRLAPNWRRPRGKDNKMRLQVSGVPRLVKIGYRGPKVARGLHPSGYKDILVFNVKDLSRIDQATDAIRIARTVGRRKRAEIVSEANKMQIKILNPGKIEVEESQDQSSESAAEDNEG